MASTIQALSSGSGGLVSSGDASGILQIQTGSGPTTAITVDTSQNVGVGVTPSFGASKALQVSSGASIYSGSVTQTILGNNWYNNGGDKFLGTGYAALYQQNNGAHYFQTSNASGTAGNTVTFTQAMTLDASGNLLVGTTTAGAGIAVSTKFSVDGGSLDCAVFKASAGAGYASIIEWNSATTGNNIFTSFLTEGGTGTQRGTITYNRSAGLVAYNTTSDYRSKDIIGPVTDSGAVIDSTPVYMGKMKDATQARPMFIAHETPDYAHTGEKDAVDSDGNPIYQQMDAGALIPVMWAEIQSLRARLKAANIA